MARGRGGGLPGRRAGDRRDEAPRRLAAAQRGLGRALRGRVDARPDPRRLPAARRPLGPALPADPHRPRRRPGGPVGRLLRPGEPGGSDPGRPAGCRPVPPPGRATGGPAGPLRGPVRGRRPRRLRAWGPDRLRVAPARPVLLRPARRPDPRSPDGGRPVRRGGCAGASAVAHGGPGRRARPCGRARRDGQGHGAGPVGIPARWTPGPASSSARAMRPALRPPVGSWGRCSRNPPRGGTGERVRRPSAYAFKAARVRRTRSLSRSAEPGRRSRLEAR